MRLLSSKPLGTRLPILDPVTAWPGLPVMPGEVRRPVPSIAGRIHRQPAVR